jgi:hypothetical protein
MKFIAISQPTFMPWVGYFDLIEQSETFIFLDDVEFSKQSWQQRNRVACDGDNWITIPIAKKSSHSKLNELALGSDVRACTKLINKIKNVYFKEKYFKLYFDEIRWILLDGVQTKISLSELNIKLIEFFLKILNISTILKKSSDLMVEGARSEKLVNIVNYFDVTNYISPPGSAEYLAEDFEIFNKSNIAIWLHQYEPYPYLKDNWIPYMSILDLIFRFGPDSKEIVLAGRLPLKPFYG